MHKLCLLASAALLLSGCNCGDTTPMNQCVTPTGVGTSHDSISSDETWTADGSPHLVPSGLNIPQGVTLTLAPCAVVKVGGARELYVSGRLRSQGTANQRVTITAIDPAAPWTWIDATRTVARPAIDLAFTTISGGGKVDGYPENSAMLRVRGDHGDPMLRVNDVELQGSKSVGLMAIDDATFTADSARLTITGSALEPLIITAFALTALPDGSLTGNGDDEIGVMANDRLGVDGSAISVTMHKRSVPYRIGTFGESDNIMQIGPANSGSTTLTIEPGTTVGFVAKQGWEITSSDANALGSVVARGTAAAPITFTSAVKPPRAGDWSGLYWTGVPTNDTALDHVVIEYGGNPDTTVSGFSCGAPRAPNPGTIAGGLRFASHKPVGRQILTNSVVRDSGSNGVDRGWSGDEVDYLATNTFERIAFCTQTQNRDAQGQCPDTPTCPTAP